MRDKLFIKDYFSGEKKTKASEKHECRRSMKHAVKQRKMSQQDKAEKGEEDKQRPIQNFPDYLKYVAKKSKAGFDKVHEELYRFYSESFSKADKVQHSSSNQQKHNINQDKGRSGSRKWSTYRRFWSSTGHSKPVGQSFISYLPEEREDLGSSTSSNMSFPLLSDEYDSKKEEDKGLHVDGTCSASLVEKDKKLFDFDRYRYSMPHLELTKDEVYANDRVLHVETLAETSEFDEEEDKFSAIYAVPNCQREQVNSHKHDNNIYINLQTPYTENQGNTLSGTNICSVIEIEPVKDNQVPFISETCRKNVVNLGSGDGRSTQLKSVVSNVNKAKIGDVAKVGDVVKVGDVAMDEDHDYLPPSQWFESTDNIPEEKPGKNKHPWTAKRQANICDEILNGHGNDVRPNSDVDDEYLPISSWLDPDYVNVTTEKKIPVLDECLGNKNFASKLLDGTKQIVDSGEVKDEERFNESDYDRPTDWIQTGEKMKIGACTDNLHTKVEKHVNTDSSDGYYNVPGRINVVKDSSAESLKADSSIPKTDTSEDTDNGKPHYVNEKADHASDDTEFYKYSVDEVVECFSTCALDQLAKICQEEKLDGGYFRGLTADDMKKEPFNMNWFFIYKLFKVIEGWRPKE